ncbi:MAG: hypothetical protein KBS41_01195 [Oscillospiraceae bacterium]|nr:hypothetical protein [Candidatus Equicaccousia limihippi]
MATLNTQTILDNQTAAYKKLAAEYAAANKQYLKDIAKSYDIKRQSAKAAADTATAALEKDFRQNYDLNAVENLIAQRRLKEKMAQLGLSDSGLNASSITALNVSRKNADDSVSAAKSAASAKIKSQLNSTLADIDAAQSGDQTKAAKDLADKLSNAYKDYKKEYTSTLQTAQKQSSSKNSGSNLMDVYGKLYSIKGASNRKAFLKAVTAAGYITESQRKALLQVLNLRDN